MELPGNDPREDEDIIILRYLARTRHIPIRARLLLAAYKDMFGVDGAGGARKSDLSARVLARIKSYPGISHSELLRATHAKGSELAVIIEELGNTGAITVYYTGKTTKRYR